MMAESILQPPTRVSARPIHVLLAPFPVACFVGTLLTDIAYVSTANTMWANFSAWLVTAGVILSVIAAVAGLFDFFSNRLFGDRVLRAPPPAWGYIVGNIVVLVLGILNLLVHTHDAWSSVMPWGLTLSILTVIVILLASWMGWSTVDRYDRYEVGDAR